MAAASSTKAKSRPPLPRLLLGVSTKMYFTHRQTLEYISSFRTLFPSAPNTEVTTPPSPVALFLIPSFPALVPSATLLRSHNHILLGAQDCHWEDSGPHTGSVSPAELSEIGCRIVELGHAERRAQPFFETDAMVAAKAAAALRNRLIPLVCIGEKNASKSGVVSEGVGIALREVIPQVEAVMAEIKEFDGDVVFAYEPVWAIGKDVPAGQDHVRTVARSLKDVLKKWDRKGEVRILYGGSAGPGTWKGLKDDLDGLFLGRFAHDLDNVKKVVTEMGY